MRSLTERTLRFGRATGLRHLPGTVLLWVCIIAMVMAVGTVAAAVHLGSSLAHDGQRLPANPFELVLGLLTQKVIGPPAAIWVLAGLGAAAAACAVLVARAVPCCAARPCASRRRTRHRVLHPLNRGHRSQLRPQSASDTCRRPDMPPTT